MKLVKEEFKVFKIDELTEEARAKAVEKNRDINVDHRWWDDVYYNFKEEMMEIGFEVDKIYFSGFYSQGDGACFEGRMTDLKVFLRHFKKGNEFRKFYNKHNILKIWTKHSGNYYHSGMMDVNVEDDSMYYGTTNNIDAEEWRDFENFVTFELREKADELYEQLEQEHRDLTSDEGVTETLRINEYDFLEDGTFYVPRGKAV
jgi:hypothetical protein